MNKNILNKLELLRLQIRDLRTASVGIPKRIIKSELMEIEEKLRKILEELEKDFNNEQTY